MAGISPNIMLWVGPFTTFHSAFVHATSIGPGSVQICTGDAGLPTAGITPGSKRRQHNFAARFRSGHSVWNVPDAGQSLPQLRQDEAAIPPRSPDSLPIRSGKSGAFFLLVCDSFTNDARLAASGAGSVRIPFAGSSTFGVEYVLSPAWWYPPIARNRDRLLLVPGCRPGGAGDSIGVNVDQPSSSSYLPVSPPIVVGNPLIGRRHLQKRNRRGDRKKLWRDQLIAMDRSGEILVDRLIQVEGRPTSSSPCMRRRS